MGGGGVGPLHDHRLMQVAHPTNCPGGRSGSFPQAVAGGPLPTLLLECKRGSRVVQVPNAAEPRALQQSLSLRVRGG